MIRMLRCECCATMRLLIDVWHVILQRCTTVARLLGILPTSIYTLYMHRIVMLDTTVKLTLCSLVWCMIKKYPSISYSSIITGSLYDPVTNIFIVHISA